MNAPTLADLDLVTSAYAESLQALERAYSNRSPFTAPTHGTLPPKYTRLHDWFVAPRGEIETIPWGTPGESPLRILLAGPAGSGKTTFVAELATKLLASMRDAVAAEANFFPIVASLPDFVTTALTALNSGEGLSLESYLLNQKSHPWLPTREAQALRPFIVEREQEAWKAGRAFVILEGFEQIYSRFGVGGEAERHQARCHEVLYEIQQFIETLRAEHRLVVTSRPMVRDSAILTSLRKVSLLPLDETSRAEFFTRVIPIAVGAPNAAAQRGILDLLRSEITRVPEFARAIASPDFASAAVWAAKDIYLEPAPKLAWAVENALLHKRISNWANKWQGMNTLQNGGPPFIHERALRATIENMVRSGRLAIHKGFKLEALESCFDDSWPRSIQPRLPDGLVSLPELAVLDSGLLEVRSDSTIVLNPICLRLATPSSGFDTMRAMRSAEVDEEQAIRQYVVDLEAALHATIEANTKEYVPMSANEEVPDKSPKTEPHYPYYRRVSPINRLSPRVQFVSSPLGEGEAEFAMNATEGLPDSPLITNVARKLVTSDCPLVLLGNPGSGKSLTLAETARALAQQYLRRRPWHREPRVPVLIRLGEFSLADDSGQPDRERLWAYILNQLGPSCPLVPLLWDLAQQGRVVWLLDAMDEMSRAGYEKHADVLSQFAASTSGMGNRCILSCRTTDFVSTVRHKKLILIPFDQKQIALYLDRHLPFATTLRIGDEQFGSARKLARRLTSRDILARLGQDNIGNPFLLKLLCNYLHTHAKWPSSRVELLHSYLEDEHWRKENEATRGFATQTEKNSPEYLAKRAKLFQQLARLAYRIADRGMGCFIPEKELLDTDLAQKKEMVDMIQQGRSCGFLVARNDARTIGFVHHRIDEYFTALYLGESGMEIDWMTKLDSPRWLETMQNLILLGDKRQDALLALCAAVSHPFVAKQEQIDAYRASSDAKRARPFQFKDEIELALRVEVAARMVGQAHGVIRAVEVELLPRVRNGIEQLAAVGRDATVVRMMWAAQHLPPGDSALVEIKKVIDSCKWVKREAFKLRLTNRNFRKHMGADQDELALNLAAGSYLQNRSAMKEALKKTDDASVHRAANSALVWYGIESIAVLGLLIAIAMGKIGPFFATHWHWNAEWWEPVYRGIGFAVRSLFQLDSAHTVPAHFLTFEAWMAIGVLCAAIYGAATRIFHRDSVGVGQWAIGALDGVIALLGLVGCMILIPMAVSLYSWSVASLVLGLLAGICLCASCLAYRQLLAFVRLGCLIGYSLTSGEPRSESAFFRSPLTFARRVWVGVFGSVFAAWSTLFGAVLGLGAMVCLPVLYERAALVGFDPKMLVAWILRISVILGVLWASLALVVLWEHLWTKAKAAWLAYASTAYIYVCAFACIVVAGIVIDANPAWLAALKIQIPAITANFPWIGSTAMWLAKIGSWIIGIIVGIALVGGVVEAVISKVPRWWKRLTMNAPVVRQFFIKPISVTDEAWAAELKGSTAEEQSFLLREGYRTASPAVFREVLEAVEPHIKEDPARSAYGLVLTQVIERLRHEKRASEG